MTPWRVLAVVRRHWGEMSAYDDPGSRSLIRALVAGLVVILPLAAAAAGILGYLELPGSWPWEERRLRPYEADLSKPDGSYGFP